ALQAEPDYVALGPIYPTILKAMKWAPQGLDRIAIWKQRVAASHSTARASGCALRVISVTTAAHCAPCAKTPAMRSTVSPPMATSGSAPTRCF
ncbi:hypothetical protein EN808_36075, partial [Mesorhizobium sp. M8A.F.Ca.ET.165.01.1.1]